MRKRKICAREKLDGLLPIFRFWLRHSMWCHDKQSLVRLPGCAGQAHGRACALTTGLRGRRQRARHGVIGLVPRHQFLCHDMVGLRQAGSRPRHDFSCRDGGSRWSVAIRLLVSRHGGCMVMSRHSFWCRDMGVAIWCRDTLFGVATWFGHCCDHA